MNHLTKTAVKTGTAKVETLPYTQAVKTLGLPGLEANLFSSSAWMAVLQETYDIKLFVKYILRDGKPSSAIVYSAVRNFLEWKICVCSYCDYCDGHVQSAEDWRLFFDALRAEYPEYRIAVRNLRDPHVREAGVFEVLSTEQFHSLDLTGSPRELWQRAHKSFRAAVKQGGRNGVAVRPARHEELPDFYRLHQNLRRTKHRLFAQPYRFFEAVWHQYMDKDQGILLAAYDPQGRMIAANVYLVCGKTLYYKFNTSALDALRLRANNLLFWKGMELAQGRGMASMDLGSSGNHQKGLILFKEHTGAVGQTITHLGFTPEGYRFSEKRILRAFTNLMTQPWVPEWALRWGSGVIYPYLA